MRPSQAFFDNLEDAPFGSIFEVRANHFSVLVRDETERLNQIKAFAAAGLGPFGELVQTNTSSVYCGQNITYMNKGQATPLGHAAFLELIQLDGPDNDFFKDYYESRGPSIVYLGLGLAPNVTRTEMLEQLELHNIPVLMSWAVVEGFVYVDMINLGYVYAEVVSGIQLP
jgi:hypothetical protein